MTFALLDTSDVCYAVTDTQPPSGKWVVVPPGTGNPVGKVWTGWQFQARRLTAYQFLQRFTWQERSAIRIASFDDDAVADFLTLCTAAQEVVSDDPVTVAGMDYLVSLNLLTPARRAEILS